MDHGGVGTDSYVLGFRIYFVLTMSIVSFKVVPIY